MADAYLGEIRIFAGDFAPKGWAFCNGQTLPISQYTALFSILGVQYGGDGKTTFALPNLMGKAPMHFGSGQALTPRTIGQPVGTATVTLTTAEMPKHSHLAMAQSNAGDTDSPENHVTAKTMMGRTAQNFYATSNITQMSPMALSTAGGNQPHNNMQPYLAMNFIICLQGEFPSRG